MNISSLVDYGFLDKNGPQPTIAMMNLSGMYKDEGRYAEAETLNKRALAVDEKDKGSEHPDVGIELNNLADLYDDERRYAEAEPLYKRALAIDEKALGPEHPKVTASLLGLASVYDAEGRYADAEPLYQRGNENTAHELRGQLPYMSEKERLEFLATLDSQFPAYFSFVHRYRDRDPKLVGEMYDLLLMEKGMVVGATAAVYRQIESSGDQRALKTFQQLARTRQQIAALYQRGGGGQQLVELEGQANELERQLAKLSQSFSRQQKLAETRWQHVRGALRLGEAAVEFTKFGYHDAKSLRYHDGKHWTESSYYTALVLTPDATAGPLYVFLGDADKIDTQGVSEYLEESRGATPVHTLSMHDVLWKPLEPLLGNAKRIYISPDGVLNQISLGLIRGPGGQLLLERYDLRVVNSTRDLLRDNSPSSARTAVLVGNPTFDLSESQQRHALAALTNPPNTQPKKKGEFQVVALEQVGAATTRSDELNGGALKPLPQTAIEITELDQVLDSHGWMTTPLTDKQALKAAVVQVAHPRVLHIATHGFFLSDQQVQIENGGAAVGTAALKEDPMLRSGLYLAGADRALSGHPSPPGLDDGILTAYEASALDLNGTELVVLSACDTGLGETQAGEGVFGLRRALQEAGAESVLMSMWEVPDRETRELMHLFYEKWLAGESKPDALRHAELDEREVVRHRYGEDLPRRWGGFVLVSK
jgi:CHAT domain-containing protein/tetratricopeptide (TPR) repeat protein